MSIEDSTDLPPQRNTLYTAAELFVRQPALNDPVIYRLTDTLEYAAVISAVTAHDGVMQRLTVFHPYGDPFNVSAAQGAGVGEWRYGD